MNSTHRILLVNAGFILAAATGLYGYYSWVLVPTYQTQAEAMNRISVLQEMLRTTPDVSDELNRHRQELEKLTSDVERIRDAVPEQPEDSSFMQQLSDASKLTGFHIETFRRDKPIEGQLCSTLEIGLTGHGSFASIYQFLQSIRTNKRLATIQRFNLQGRRQGEYPVEMTILLYFGLKSIPAGAVNG